MRSYLVIIGENAEGVEYSHEIAADNISIESSGALTFWQKVSPDVSRLVCAYAAGQWRRVVPQNTGTIIPPSPDHG